MYSYLYKCMMEWFRPQYDRAIHVKIMATNVMTAMLMVNVGTFVIIARHMGVNVPSWLRYESVLGRGAFLFAALVIFVGHFMLCPKIALQKTLTANEVAKRRRVAVAYSLSSLILIVLLSYVLQVQS
jgi:hypothetical protein